MTSSRSDFSDKPTGLRPMEPVTFGGIFGLMQLDFLSVIGLYLFSVMTDSLNQQAGELSWP